MTAQDDEQRDELHVVFLGPPQKSILFDKLCMAAAKYEQHVTYSDVHYLTVNVDSKPEIVQFTDPGLAKTGGREMAIRNADFAILFYSAMNLNSIEQLQTLREDLERKKNIPVRLICDTDDIQEYDEDGTSTGISSLSEGYESDPEREPQRPRRRPSMEKIRRHAEDYQSGIDMGLKFAGELGERCTFMKLSSSQYEGYEDFLREVVLSVKSKKRRRRSRSLIPRLRSKSRDTSTHPHQAVMEAWSTDDSAPRKQSVVKESKVCSIM